MNWVLTWNAECNELNGRKISLLISKLTTWAIHFFCIFGSFPMTRRNVWLPRNNLCGVCVAILHVYYRHTTDHTSIQVLPWVKPRIKMMGFRRKIFSRERGGKLKQLPLRLKEEDFWENDKRRKKSKAYYIFIKEGVEQGRPRVPARL